MGTSAENLRLQYCGITGLSLSGIFAAYSISASECIEDLEKNLKLCLITIAEISAVIKGKWILTRHIRLNFFLLALGLRSPTSGFFTLEGISKYQAAYLISKHCLRVSVLAILENYKIIVHGDSEEIEQLKRAIETLEVANYRFLPVSEAEFRWHATDPVPLSKSNLIMEEVLPKIIWRISYYAKNTLGVSNPFDLSCLKIPLVSCFTGELADKTMLQNDWGFSVRTTGNLMGYILEFLKLVPINVAAVLATAQYLLSETSPHGTSLKVLQNGFSSRRVIELNSVLPTNKSTCMYTTLLLQPSFNSTFFFFSVKNAIKIGPNQQLIALHQYNNPQSSVYNLTDVIKVKTEGIDRERAVFALELALYTHPALAMRYVIDGESIEAIPLEREEIHSIAAKQLVIHQKVKQVDVQSVITSNTKTPFDIFNGNLARVHLIPIEDTPFIIAQGIIHHVAADGFSGFMLTIQFLQFYDSDDSKYFAHRAYLIREQELSGIRHYNSMQRCVAKQDSLNKQYWKELIKSNNFSFSLDMMRTYPHSNAPSFQGKEIITAISNEFWISLGNKAKFLGCSKFHLLLAAWSIVIMRYSQQDLINVGTAFHCRNAWNLDLTAFLSNAMPVPIQVSPRTTLQAYVNDIKKGVDAAKKHEDYPAALLIQDIFTDETLSATIPPWNNNPLFNVEINYYHIPMLPKYRGKRLQFHERLYPEYMQAGLAQLAVWIIDMGGGDKLCNIKYNTEAYDEATAKQLERHLFLVLNELIRVPESTPVLKISLVDQVMGDELTTGPIIKTKFVPPVYSIFQAAQKNPQGTAIVFENEIISYGLLLSKVMRVANSLQHYPKGTVVGVYMQRSAEFVISMLGIMTAGCVYLPLNLEIPVDRTKAIINEAKVGVILFHQSTASSLEQWINIPNVDEIQIDTQAEQQSGVSLPILDQQDPCYMIFTSGSTGKPKGVVVPHKALANFIHWKLSTFEFPDDYSFLHLFDFSFDASLQDVFAALSSGNRLILSQNFGNKDPQYIVDQISKYNVNMVNLVPSQLVLLVEYLTQHSNHLAKLSSLKLMGVGGEPLLASLVNRIQKLAPHTRVFNWYGPTEACILCSYFDCGTAQDSAVTEHKRKPSYYNYRKVRSLIFTF